jgi:glyoxylase-like metal-dependent hydrolase (beta-lactamase superfamily II)
VKKRTGSDSVVTIDCKYIEPEYAAAYLIIERDRAAFVDNNTVFAVPLLMDALEARGLRPPQVDYAIVTHIHLDHAGGTSALLERCPNAIAVVHPRGARHLVDPSRLVASAAAFYGEETFRDRYGTITPAEADRVRAVEDGETLDLGKRTFTFLHTLGHARHHMCIHDSGANAVFTGDSFGLAFPVIQGGVKPFLIASSAPTDFDPAEARKSVERILNTGAERAYLTHFGCVEPVDKAAEQLLRSIDSMERIMNEAAAANLTGDELTAFCEQAVRKAFADHAADCGVEVTAAGRRILEHEVFLNSRGIAYAVSKSL